MKERLTSTSLGILVIGAAFLSVFGSSLHNLKPQEVANTTASVQDAVVENKAPLEEQKPVTTVKPVATTTTTTTTVPKTNDYTLAEVGTHNSATSCWSAINGEVYDLTSWVNLHPGGRPAILMICGKDGSALFNLQHGGQSRPNSILASYFIGSFHS